MRTRFIVLYLLFCIVQIFPQQDDFQKFIENKLNYRTLTTYESKFRISANTKHWAGMDYYFPPGKKC